jgi:hypothetical protein
MPDCFFRIKKRGERRKRETIVAARGERKRRTPFVESIPPFCKKKEA